MKEKCQHCKTRAVIRKSRRLCLVCFDSPVRELYPLKPGNEVYARRGVGAGTKGEGRLPREPTTALPGTPEKVKVMADRASRRESLHHPLDARAGPGDE